VTALPHPITLLIPRAPISTLAVFEDRRKIRRRRSSTARATATANAPSSILPGMIAFSIEADVPTRNRPWPNGLAIRRRERVSNLIPLIGVAKLNDIDPQAWLVGARRGMADHSTFPIRRVAALEVQKNHRSGRLSLILSPHGSHKMLAPKMDRGGFAAAHRKVRSVRSRCRLPPLIVAESIATYNR
jgi:hypothetical protein